MIAVDGTVEHALESSVSLTQPLLGFAFVFLSFRQPRPLLPNELQGELDLPGVG